MASRTASPQDSQRVSAIIEESSFKAETSPDKISAYYSLVFPSFTYYLQTLNVTIGRRCIPTSTASSSEQTQVDVDLGPLKSVSRLHARIEYEEEEEQFVLVVLGRNGAWVDGTWCGKGRKVPLSERSQIQIASRTFHFVLPPPPALENSPPPSPEPSAGRQRSPSVDITSLSPPSPLPSGSPPPGPISPPPRKAPPLPPPISQTLPNSNAIGKAKSTAGKARKQQEPPAPITKPAPEDMPPKPPFTYAQLCYRAIKSLGGKATLQDIISWMMENFDWYRFNVKTGWEKSVRHNLSSNRAFRKIERSPGERGKGFYWAVEADCERMFEEQEARAASSAASGGKDSKAGGRKGKTPAVLEPPLKRSVRGEPKGAPLPPPLTSTPLVFKREAAPQLIPSSASGPSIKDESPLPSHQSLSNGTTNSTLAQFASATSKLTSPQAASATPSADPSSSATTSGSSIPPIPASVILPIIVGPVPASHPSATTPGAAQNTDSATPHISTPPIVLHENQLILNPTIFSHLTPEQLRELEALGAQKALEILQGHIVRFLKERIKTEGRARGRGRVKRGRGSAPSNAAAQTEKQEKSSHPGTGLFTTTPLLPRNAPPPMDALLPTPSPSGASDGQVEAETGPSSPIVVVDDDEPSDGGPAHKRRRLGINGVPATPVAV